MADAARPWTARPDSAEPPTDDRAELQRLRAGEQTALEVLHKRHAQAVYWVARSILGTAVDAEEATQDAFVLLWRKSSRIELVGTSTLPWLLVTVKLVAANILRARRRRAAHIAEFPDNELPDPTSPEDAAIAAMELTRVDALIAALPKADRDIYRLCVTEGLSYKQAAYQLRVSHATVRIRLSRIRATLRKETGR